MFMVQIFVSVHGTRLKVQAGSSKGFLLLP